MAELAIHDPHYLNVESDQKTAIVHLFHNPIPADGHRDEGPEWAREVDDIYLIGGVGPDGPTVKTVTNDEVTEWSSGSGNNYRVYNSTITHSGKWADMSFVVWNSTYNIITATHHNFNNEASFYPRLVAQDGIVPITSVVTITAIKIGGEEIPFTFDGNAVYAFKAPSDWDGNMEVVN